VDSDIGRPAGFVAAGAVVSSYVDLPHFLPRPWLTTEVEDALAAPDCRFVAVTAAPGAGKSALVAELSRKHPSWPVYFIRRDQRTASHQAGVRSFLLHVGFQLAVAYPELFEPRNVQLAVEQRVGTLRASADLVGAELGRVLASPFHHQIVKVRQEIQDSQGRGVALRIDELVADPAQLTIDQLEQQALLDPAAAARALHPDLQIVVMVDALDELRYHRSDEPLLAWLTNLNVPSNVRFLVTTRPADSAVAHFFAKNQPVLRSVAISPSDPHTQADVLAYARQLVRRPQVAVHVGDPDDTARRLAEKANGILGYLDAFGRALEAVAAAGDTERIRSWLRLDDLPEELTGLYGFFLLQVRAHLVTQSMVVDDPATGVPRYIDAWSLAAKPALSVQAVAYEPLTLAQVLQLARVPLDISDFASVFDWLTPFLNSADGGFQLYHSSLREFLIHPARRDDPSMAFLYVDEQAWHRRVADVYWRELANGDEPHDGYGLRHLAEHLFDARDERLSRLITRSWAELRRRRDGGHFGGFLADLGFAERAASASGSLSELMRLRIARSVVREKTHAYSDDDLATLTLLGRYEEAIAHAEARQQPDTVLPGLIMIAEATAARSDAVPADLVAEIEHRSELTEDPSQRIVYKTITARLQAFGQRDGGRRALDQAHREAQELAAPTLRAKMLAIVAITMMDVGHPAGPAVLQDVVREASAIHHDTGYWFRPAPGADLRQRDWALRDIAMGLADAGHLDEATQIAQEIAPRESGNLSQGRALLDVVAAQVSAGLLEAAAATAASIGHDLPRSAALRQIARARAGLGQIEEAMREVELLERDDIKNLARQELAAVFFANGATSQAEQLLDQIDKPQDRVVALSAAALMSAASGDRNQEAVSLLLSRAQAVAAELVEDDRREGLLRVAFAEAQTGALEDAIRLVDEALTGTTPTPPQPEDQPEWDESFDFRGDDDHLKYAALLEKFGDLSDGPGNMNDRLGPSLDASTRPEALRKIAELLIDDGQLEPARALLDEVHDPGEAAHLSRRLAHAMAAAGHVDAEHTWSASEEVTGQEIAKQPIGAVAAPLAAALAGLGSAAAKPLFHAAAILADGEPDAARQDAARRELCHSLGEAGDFSAFQETLAQIKGKEAFTRAHRDLVVGLIQADKLSDAIEAAALLDPQHWSDDCWWGLGVARIKAGEARAGLDDLTHIQSREARYGATVGATQELLATGQVQDAVALLLENGWARDDLIVSVWARVLSEATPFEPVCAALLSAHPSADARGKSPALEPANRPGTELIAAVAEATARAGREQDTLRLLAAITAKDTDDLFGDEDTDDPSAGYYSVDGIRMAAAYAAAKEGNYAAALRWAGRIRSPSMAATGYAYIAGVAARDDTTQAADLLDRAERALERASRTDDDRSALLMFSWALQPIDASRSDHLLNQFIAPLREERNSPTYAHAMLALAMRLAEVGDTRAIELIDVPEAVSLRPLVISLAEAGCFEAALKVARAEVFDPGRSLIDLIGALADAKHLDQALELVSQIADPDARREAQIIVCDELMAADRETDAIRTVSGSAEELLTTFARWAPQLNAAAPGSFEESLAPAIEVASWYSAAWSAAQSLLSAALDADTPAP
jgi:hypothetical protein